MNRRPIVAQTVFSRGSDSGGIGPVLKGLTQQLVSSSLADVRTYVPRYRHPKSDADWPGTLTEFGCLGPAKHCIDFNLWKRMKRDGIQLIHTHGLWTCLSRNDLAWKRKTGRPYVVSPHGMTMPNALKYARFKKGFVWSLWEKKHLNNAACIHALSKFEAESVRDLGITSPICVISNGAELPDLSVALELENRGPSLPRKVQLVYLGRLHPIKGLDKLIRAWSLLTNQGRIGDRWQLVIAGWGEGGYDERLKKLCESEIRSGSIVFTGPLFGADKARLFRNASGFVLPSTSEAFPMALLEAWSYGLPCLATETCRVIDDRYSNASLFVPGTVEGITAGLVKLLEMPTAERTAMGNLARKMVATQFSWQTVAEEFAAVYRWALGMDSKPNCVIL